MENNIELRGSFEIIIFIIVFFRSLKRLKLYKYLIVDLILI